MEEFKACYFDDAVAFVKRQIELSEQESPRYVFRGHRNADWCLLPTAHRNDCKSKVIDEFVDRNVGQFIRFVDNFRWKNETEEKFEIRLELALRYFLETKLIDLFHQTAVEWDLLENIDRQRSEMASLEQIKHYLASCEVPYRSDGRSMEAKAQLQGIPTKMILSTSITKHFT